MTSLTTSRAAAAIGIAILCGSGCASSAPRARATASRSHPTTSTAPPELSAGAEGVTTRPGSTAGASTTTAVSQPPAPTSAPSTAPTTVPAALRGTPLSTTSTTGPPAPTGTCPSDTAQGLASTGSASQLITVESDSYATTYASLSAWHKQGRCWVQAYGPWTARIGANGFSDHKSEGDDTTPTGAYGIGPIMYGNAANPGVTYSYHRLVCGDWWDEDPNSAGYNTFQHVPCGQTPSFGGNSEALWKETTAYPSFAVVDYNTSPVVKGAGSAIFIHADVGGPTAGCVSLPRSELDAMLDWLAPGTEPLIVMGPGSEINRF